MFRALMYVLLVSCFVFRTVGSSSIFSSCLVLHFRRNSSGDVVLHARINGVCSHGTSLCSTRLCIKSRLVESYSNILVLDESLYVYLFFLAAVVDGSMNIICSLFGTGFGAVPYQVSAGLVGFCRVRSFLYYLYYMSIIELVTLP